jgi:hypothetical protein
MQVVSFIEPPQGEVIEKILKHCGLWRASAPRAPPDVEGLVLELDAAYANRPIGSADQADESRELTYVDIDTFLAVERILASSIWPFHLLEIGPGVEIKFPISFLSVRSLDFESDVNVLELCWV